MHEDVSKENMVCGSGKMHAPFRKAHAQELLR
jgi:hypothetical protein